MVTVSFGYELEFYYLKKDSDNNIDTILQYHGVPNPIPTIDNWGYQGDYTAGTELRTPVFTYIYQAIESINREFRYWVEQNTFSYYEYVPYFYNHRHTSIGQHHHYGVPNRELNYNEKYAIAFYISRFYPFLASIYANPIPSHRGLTSMYCRGLHNYGDKPINYEHYSEISDSSNGTVELRLFDANIPQLAITTSSLVIPIVKKTLENQNIINKTLGKKIKKTLYKNERTNALKYGLSRLNIKQYLRLYLRHIGDVELPNIKSVKEILYLGIKHKLNPYQVYRKLIRSHRINKFDYFKVMVTNVEKYLDNLDSIVNNGYPNSLTNIIEDVKDNAYSINRLSQYLEILEHEREITVRDIIPKATYPLRTYVRNLVNSESGLSHVYVSRIHEIEGYDTNQVANIISSLINNYGGNFVNQVTSDYVINANERFYLIWFRHPINDSLVPIGTIAIRIRTGEIKSFVIHPRFRGLGLGRRILKWIIDLAKYSNLDSVHLWIRQDNLVMKNLVESLGFVKTGKSDRSYKYVLNLKGGV